MKVLSCASVRRRLDRWHDGELPPGDHYAVSQHLADCPPCAAEARALERIGEVLRDSAARRGLSADAATGLRSGVLARLKAEDDQSWTSQLRVLFEDMHLVWAGLSATAAMAICVALLSGIAYLTPAERADSLAGMLNAMGAEARAPRDSDAVRTAFANGVTEGDLVLALATVVAQEGPGRRDREAVLQLMDAVAAARLEGVQPDGRRVAVDVVWRDGPHLRLLQHMTVLGKATLS
jgi:anti-sigma factor RsiW